MREVKQLSYLQIVQSTLNTSTRSHNLYLIQSRPILRLDLLCMLVPIRRHPWTNVSQLFKYSDHNQYEILISQDENLSTQNLCEQPFSSLLSRLMC